MSKLLVLLTLGMFWFTSCTVGSKTPAPDDSGVRIQEMKLGSQAWTFRRWSFFETLDRLQELGIKYLEAYPGQVLDSANPDLKFDHHLNPDQINTVKQALQDHGVSLVNYGVVGIENDEASLRQVFDFARLMGIQTLVMEPEFDDFSLLERTAREYRVQVAIHNHPAPSKYARPEAVLESLQGLDRRLGACVDIGHWLRSGIDVLEGLRMLRGRVLDIHLEDLDAVGSGTANTVPFGQGKARIKAVLEELTRQNYAGILAIELEQEEVVINPGPTIRKSIEYLDSITYYKGWERLLAQRYGAFSKHGWNHYGPGYFELDHLTGILKSHGGMGLFWYSAKKYRDFVLELEFKCSHPWSNSGIFLRVPAMPVSNEYIFHSFEVQIDDASEGIHKTAAVYDAEPASLNASNPTGEWNHYRITFQGENIKVELNAKEVVDWMAEPRGKIADFAREGYIGLQNHDWDASVSFRNIYVKELE